MTSILSAPVSADFMCGLTDHVLEAVSLKVAASVGVGMALTSVSQWCAGT